MQSDLKLRFGIGGGLVGRITVPASCSWNRTLTVGVLDGQFAPLGKQQTLVSVPLSSIHFHPVVFEREDSEIEGHILHPQDGS
jgi:hypothetical protein